MRADKVVEKDEHGNEVVGRSKGRKALLGFVPCLELLVEALNEVVGNVVMKTLNTDMFNPMQRLDRYLIGEVTVYCYEYCNYRIYGSDSNWNISKK